MEGFPIYELDVSGLWQIVKKMANHKIALSVRLFRKQSATAVKSRFVIMRAFGELDFSEGGSRM